MTLEERRVVWEKRRKEKALNSLKKLIVSFMIMMAAVVAMIIIDKKISRAESASDLYKYYTTVEIQYGDNLTNIARDHLTGYSSVSKYINEVCFINHLEDADSIRVGQKITIPYFSDELK